MDEFNTYPAKVLCFQLSGQYVFIPPNNFSVLKNIRNGCRGTSSTGKYFVIDTFLGPLLKDRNLWPDTLERI